jgi:hypothetical protein
MHDLIDSVEPLPRVRRQARRVAEIADRTRDRLANPPSRVRGEFVAAAVIKFLHRAHETDVTFLNQIKQCQPASDVPFGEIDDESQIRLDQTAARRIAHPNLIFEPCLEFTVVTVVSQTSRRRAAAPHFLCQLDFLPLVQQWSVTDLTQIEIDEIADAAGIIMGNGFRTSIPAAGRWLD